MDGIGFFLLIFFFKNECSNFHKRVSIESSLTLLCACILPGLLLLTPLCTAFEKVFGEIFNQFWIFFSFRLEFYQI